MLKVLIQRFLANPKHRIYVVSGEQWDHFDEPGYCTDPAYYGFDIIKGETKSPQILPGPFWERSPGTPIERGPEIIKAFKIAHDAISFAYCCNLVNVLIYAYDRVNGEWVCSEDQSELDIDW